MNLRVAIAGASGYAGGEVARLLAGHPNVSDITFTAHSNAGELVGDVHPHLATHATKRFVETSPETLADHDVLVLALPHGTSGELGEALLHANRQKLLIDVGADRRLVNPAAWDAFYGGTHYAPFTYGLPELLLTDGSRQRERLVGATSIVAPGCNATAVTLALAPLLVEKAISEVDISAVLAVGPSGAGKTSRPDLMGAELMGSAHPYAVGGSHRHIPEIQQNLKLASNRDITLSLTPVVVPMSRGILATVSATILGNVDHKGFHQILRDAYDAEPFVRVLPLGQFPRTADVVGSNTVSLGIAVDGAVNRVIVVAALDNLVKGTAGATVQSMNLALGIPETTGLTANGVAP